tara:strand:+ start:193 stop:414 length:222 start_codon:yes stop_codon:yes gene_type:complete
MSNLRVTSLRGRTAGSSPTLPDGAVVTGVTTSTTFDGNVTGNVTGDVNAGIITASQYVGIPEGTNVLKSMLFV